MTFDRLSENMINTKKIDSDSNNLETARVNVKSMKDDLLRKKCKVDKDTKGSIYQKNNSLKKSSKKKGKQTAKGQLVKSTKEDLLVKKDISGKINESKEGSISLTTNSLKKRKKRKGNQTGKGKVNSIKEDLLVKKSNGEKINQGEEGSISQSNNSLKKRRRRKGNRKGKGKSMKEDLLKKKSNGEKNNQGEEGSISQTNNSLKKSRKRKAAKKDISGLSNWALLCSELKTDPLERKRHSEKIPTESQEADDEPMSKKQKKEIWFDDVDEDLLNDEEDDTKTPTPPPATQSQSLVKEASFTGKTKCVGMDCEMVGVGKDGEESILARVSLVNIYGHCLYDKYVLPREHVTDYRTFVSGVTKRLLEEKGEPFMTVQKEVSDILQDSILVGHALQNDLKVLFLGHPHKNIRDTSVYKPFRAAFNGQKPSLKKLAEKFLGVKVQDGAHSSVEDAQAAMRLYTMHRKQWDKELKSLGRMRTKKKAKSKKKEIKDTE